MNVPKYKFFSLGMTTENVPRFAEICVCVPPLFHSSGILQLALFRSFSGSVSAVAVPRMRLAESASVEHRRGIWRRGGGSPGSF